MLLLKEFLFSFCLISNWPSDVSIGRWETFILIIPKCFQIHFAKCASFGRLLKINYVYTAASWLEVWCSVPECLFCTSKRSTNIFSAFIHDLTLKKQFINVDIWSSLRCVAGFFSRTRSSDNTRFPIGRDLVRDFIHDVT